MSWGDVVSVAALVVSVIVAAISGRSAVAAQKRKSETDEKIARADDDNDAGRLALDYARDVNVRLSALEDWREDLVNTWLPTHLVRDRAVETELLKLDPDAHIPPMAALPPLRKRGVP